MDTTESKHFIEFEKILRIANVPTKIKKATRYSGASLAGTEHFHKVG